MAECDELVVPALPVNNNNLPSFSSPSWRFGKRHILLMLGFLGFANVYALRVNLSVALVAMVNSSFADSNSEAKSHKCGRIVQVSKIFGFETVQLLRWFEKVRWLSSRGKITFQIGINVSTGIVSSPTASSFFKNPGNVYKPKG